MRTSRPPPSCLILHTDADLPGTYWDVPENGQWLVRVDREERTNPEFRRVCVIWNWYIYRHIVC